MLTAADNLADSFNATASSLSQQQTSLDLSVVQQVGQINQLTQQIAQLNGQVSNLQNIGESAGTFVDERQQAIDQLSSLVDVSVIPTDNTLTLTTANGAPLVSGQESFQLQTQTNSAGFHEVYSQGNNITSSLTSGQLGGTIEARDQQIPAIENQLDTLAAGLANSVNAVQVGGFDLNGNAGTDLFNPPPASGAGTAATLPSADGSIRNRIPSALQLCLRHGDDREQRAQYVVDANLLRDHRLARRRLPFSGRKRVHQDAG